MPIFDSVRYAGDGSPDDEEWLNTTCLNALRCLVDLVHAFHRRAEFLLDDLLRLLGGCVLQGNESLAEIGTTTLLQFVVTAAASFRERDWRAVIDALRHVMTTNARTLHGAVLAVLEIADERADADADADAAAAADAAGPRAAEAGDVPSNAAVRTSFAVQLLLVECVDTIGASQYAHLGERLTGELLAGMLDVRRRAGATRELVQPLAETAAAAAVAAAAAGGAVAVEADGDGVVAARRASVAPTDGLSRARLAQRHAETLERLEAAAAQCTHHLAQIACDAALAADDAAAVARCERRLLLVAVRDTADALHLAPCAALGAVARVQVRALISALPRAHAARHLASLHGIGVAAAQAADRGASHAGIALISHIATMLSIADEPLPSENE
eukprot:TRINITY_DN1786_c0_g1_i1.p1 TRINITY_DN1786_c0_g1~~TRINITY_DN1786_c0_g1_i1.p1  ORF type:complete len:389 (-),score=285.24 TRINITY_DN1786_c0_g1_i1:91-1257(-)